MTITHTPPSQTADQTTATRGRRAELGAYRTADGTDRLLIGQRIDGIVHIFDEPTSDTAPTYLVEQGLETNSELEALVADYLTTAQRLGYAPMHGWF